MATKFLNGLDLANQKIVNVADPSSSTDAANKQYVDAFVRGLSWKASVRAASTANVTVSSAPASLDGVSLVSGDRVLLKDQTTGSENGIYVFSAAASALTRATDANTATLLIGATTTVTEGTTNADRVYRMITDNVTLGTTSLSWTQLGGAGTTYTAGSGLNESPAGTFNVSTGTASATGLEISGGNVRIATGAAGAGLTGGGGSALAVNPGTGLENSGGAVRIATSAAGTGLTGGGGSALAINTSVVARKFTGTVGNGSSTSIAVTHSLGTQDVLVQLTDATSHAAVMTDWVATDTNTVTLTFATAPSSGQYRVIVIG